MDTAKKILEVFVIFILVTSMALAQENPRYTNKLINEQSPYLLQHAHNPVDWYPWGEEAFQKAAREDKPILLSIGYSTCHWCHVMEKESFSDEKTAKLMNQLFVSIKVDREERPDLDTIYMNYVIGSTGRGGWPMTVFLTPEGKPFYGGTYFPPEDRYGMPGFKTLLSSVSHSWKNEKPKIKQSVDEAIAYLQNKDDLGGSVELSPSILEKAFNDYRQRFDEKWGGFGGPPKFPMGHVLSFVLREAKRFQDPEALAMVEKTLESMARGGIYDQIGGGFHRYSTDERWFLPHFEKMLYDQALLVNVYVETYQATQKKFYAEVARNTLDYVLAQMTDKGGGFYSAEDADSLEPVRHQSIGGSLPVRQAGVLRRKKKEGAFYVWQKSEIEAALSKEAAKIFCYHYGVETSGNVAADPHEEFIHKNVLYEAHSADEVTAKNLAVSRTALKEIRSKRPTPYLDDKILADWNGLMIASLASAAVVLQEDRYEGAAVKAGDFILENMRSDDGKLLHRYRNGQAGIEGYLEDYAFVVYGFIKLYEATFDDKWLENAISLSDQMTALFWDDKNKGFFLTGKNAPLLITRPKTDYDGAIPSGNSIAALDLLLLNRITGDDKWRVFAVGVFEAFSSAVNTHPQSFAQMLTAFDFTVGPSLEIVIAEGYNKDEVKAMQEEVYKHFLPNKVVLMDRKGERAKTIDGKTSAYVCRGETCQPPVTGHKDLGDILNRER